MTVSIEGSHPSRAEDAATDAIATKSFIMLSARLALGTLRARQCGNGFAHSSEETPRGKERDGISTESRRQLCSQELLQ